MIDIEYQEECLYDYIELEEATDDIPVNKEDGNTDRHIRLYDTEHDDLLDNEEVPYAEIDRNTEENSKAGTISDTETELTVHSEITNQNENSSDFHADDIGNYIDDGFFISMNVSEEVSDEKEDRMFRNESYSSDSKKKTKDNNKSNEKTNILYPKNPSSVSNRITELKAAERNEVFMNVKNSSAEKPILSKIPNLSSGHYSNISEIPIEEHITSHAINSKKNGSTIIVKSKQSPRRFCTQLSSQTRK